MYSQFWLPFLSGQATIGSCSTGCIEIVAHNLGLPLRLTAGVISYCSIVQEFSSQAVGILIILIYHFYIILLIAIEMPKSLTSCLSTVK